jgi:hypothetical protein
MPASRREDEGERSCRRSEQDEAGDEREKKSAKRAGSVGAQEPSCRQLLVEATETKLTMVLWKEEKEEGREEEGQIPFSKILGHWARGTRGNQQLRKNFRFAGRSDGEASKPNRHRGGQKEHLTASCHTSHTAQSWAQ